MADPISVGNCALWLKADDLTTIHATAGAVDTWDDKSGNARNVVATTTQRPTTGTRNLNGKNVLAFNGTSNVMPTGGANFNLTAPITWAAVMAYDPGPDGILAAIANSYSGQWGLYKSITNKWVLQGSPDVAAAPTVDTAAHSLIGLVKTGAGATVVNFDGVETTGTGGTGAVTQKIDIGSNTTGAYWNGIIAEVVVYSIELNAASRAALYSYFQAQWFTPSGPVALSTRPNVSMTAVHRAANW